MLLLVGWLVGLQRQQQILLKEAFFGRVIDCLVCLVVVAATAGCVIVVVAATVVVVVAATVLSLL